LKKIVTSALATIITPLVLNAGGIGVYIPYSLGITGNMTNTIDGHYDGGTYYPSEEYDYTYTFKNKAGIGISYATNLTKDKVFGYKIAIEYTNPQGEDSSSSADRIDMLHTFEFGVYNTQKVRLWIGPRINTGYRWYESGNYSQTAVELGIAPAIGINVNLNEHITMAFDIDYKFAVLAGSGTLKRNAESDITSTQEVNVQGSTARLSIFYRFGE